MTKLNLNENGIGAQGATGLAEALKVNSTLTMLILDRNGIGDQGATSLAEALKMNSSLKWLNLRKNYIGVTVLSELRRLEHDGRFINFEYQC